MGETLESKLQPDIRDIPWTDGHSVISALLTKLGLRYRAFHIVVMING